MKLCEIMKGLEITAWGAEKDLECSGICCDSRAVQPGDLFVAVRGFELDGHRYIPAAVEKGAAAVLCMETPECGIPWVKVADSRLGLALASRNFYRDPSSEMKVIGITGTNGKSTTAFLIKQMLEKTLGAKVGLVGSIVNMIGEESIHTEHTTPESCELQQLFRRMADAGCEYCVMEVSSHALVLDRVAGVHFAVGLFTNLTQDHLDFHRTMESYADAKALLFSRCDVSVANADDAWTERVTAGARSLYTLSAVSGDASLSAKDIRLSDRDVSFTVCESGVSYPASLAIPGLFSVYNGLSAIAACRVLGVPLDRCAAALAGCTGAKGRVEPVPTNGDYSIYIDYAVTPDAIENVLNTLRRVAKGRLVMLFGCGGDRDRKKRPIMGEISARIADFVIVTSDNPRTEDPEAIIAEILPGVEKVGKPFAVIPDRVEAIRYAIDHHEKDDVILLCGKGHEDYQIIGKTKIHMDEREIVAKYLASGH